MPDPNTTTLTPAARLSSTRRASIRLAILITVSVAVIVVCAVAGLAIGSHRMPIGDVIGALTAYDNQNTNHVIVIHSRIPRTVLALMVGLALGLAGTMMQSITRNPLADPGLFAINAGAAIAVVAAIALFGVGSPSGYIWWAFGGAGLAALAVYALGAARRGAATPVRMALAGAAIAVALGAATELLLISYESLFQHFRYWAVGSLQGRGLDVAATVAPFMAIGVLACLVLIRPLNALSLGEDAARGLGAHPGAIRGGAAIAVVLLAGAATAAAGPIGFVGLAAPHIVRMVVGSDHRRLLPGVLVTAPAFLLLADVIGRGAVAPAEFQTGLSAAILGGPIFIALVRSRHLASL